MRGTRRTEPVTHDYTARYWGHDLSYRPTGDNELVGNIWGDDLKVGDFLILRNGESTTRYQFTDVKPYFDPDDMAAFKARFAPRTEGDAS